MTSEGDAYLVVIRGQGEVGVGLGGQKRATRAIMSGCNCLDDLLADRQQDIRLEHVARFVAC